MSSGALALFHHAVKPKGVEPPSHSVSSSCNVSCCCMAAPATSFTQRRTSFVQASMCSCRSCWMHSWESWRQRRTSKLTSKQQDACVTKTGALDLDPEAMLSKCLMAPFWPIPQTSKVCSLLPDTVATSCKLKCNRRIVSVAFGTVDIPRWMESLRKVLSAVLQTTRS